MTITPDQVRPAFRSSGGFTTKLAALESLDLTSLATHAVLATAICLQRFGIPFGPATLSLSLPVLLAISFWLVLQGCAYAPARSALFFGLFVGWALISTLAAIVAPDRRVGLSLFSLLELLGLYLLLLIRPQRDFDAFKVQRIFLFYVRLCAALGLAQFVLQFAHLRLFSIQERVPGLWRWLLERDYAVISPIKYGSATLRSNGFFLLEPSIFSQVLALGVLLDVFVLGQRRWLPLYAAAYLTTFSGTGLLSLGLTLALVGMASIRSAGRVLVLGLVGCAALALMAFIAPEFFANFVGRVNELQSTQTSAYARYVAPFSELKTFAGETRLLLGYGPGATARAVSFTSGSGNAALQLIIDYGLVGAGLFCGFLVAAVWRTRHAALSIFLLVNYQFGGGYLLAPFMVALMVVVGVWATAPPCSALVASRPVRRLRLGRFAHVRGIRA